MGELRKNFGRIRRILDIPNLIDIQTDSYKKFLQEGIDPDKRGTMVCRAPFTASFPFPISAENVPLSSSVIKLVVSGMTSRNASRRE